LIKKLNMANKINKKIALSDIIQSGATNGQIPTYNSISGQYEATTPVSGSTVVADNGLTKTGSNVQLGGSLIQATDVTYGANTLTEIINSTGQHKILASGTSTNNNVTGGFFNFTQTGDGTGFLGYLNRVVATTGHFMHLNIAAGIAYLKSALNIEYIGGSHSVVIANNNTNVNNSTALKITSENTADSATFISSRTIAKATKAIVNINTSTNNQLNNISSGISIDLQDNDTTPYAAANSATATATITAGVITAVIIVSGGVGYSNAPTITFGGGGGTGATATATITAGVVTAVTITNGGTGYTSAPTVTLGINYGTSARGIFINSTTAGGTNGDFLHFRNNKSYINNSIAIFKVDSDGRIVSFPAISGTQSFQTGIQGDTIARTATLSNGTHSWGPGNAVFDINLFRLNAGTLKIANPLNTDGRLIIGPTGAAHSRLCIDGAISTKYTSIAVNTTLDITYSTVGATVNNLVVTLPDATTCSGRIYTIINTGAAIGTIVTPIGAQTINGLATQTLTAAYQKITVQSTAANWIII
jgi:hypothetical protein